VVAHGAYSSLDDRHAYSRADGSAGKLRGVAPPHLPRLPSALSMADRAKI